jgi:hypothetical protein
MMRLNGRDVTGSTGSFLLSPPPPTSHACRPPPTPPTVTEEVFAEAAVAADVLLFRKDPPRASRFDAANECSLDKRAANATRHTCCSLWAHSCTRARTKCCAKSCPFPHHQKNKTNFLFHRKTNPQTSTHPIHHPPAHMTSLAGGRQRACPVRPRMSRTRHSAL